MNNPRLVSVFALILSGIFSVCLVLPASARALQEEQASESQAEDEASAAAEEDDAKTYET